MLQIDDIVRVTKKCKGDLAGVLATVVSGPETVGGINNIYTLLGSSGVTEQWHESHLRLLKRKVPKYVSVKKGGNQ